MIKFIKKLFECFKYQNNSNNIVECKKSSKSSNEVKNKAYSPKFLDDSYANVYSLLRFEEQGYFNFKQYFKGYYDDDDIKVTILFPELIKELIDAVGVKNKTNKKLYYELDNYELTLNNNWKVKLYMVNEKKFCSMQVDSIDAVYIVGVSSEDEIVSLVSKEIKNFGRSNSYGMNFVSERTFEFEVEQIGVNYIYEAIRKFKV